MKILLCDQRRCYLNLVIKKLKHYFKNTLEICICMSLQEIEFYDKQIIDIAVVADNRDLMMLRILKVRHHESGIIFVGENYFRFHEVIRIGVKDYLMIPFEIDVLCKHIKRLLNLRSKWCLPLKQTHRKHIFILEEIKYIETSYNDMIIVTCNNQYFVVSIKNCCYLEKLLEEYFIKVNQSIFVNIQCVDFLTDNHVILQSREIFPINHKHLKSFKEEIGYAHRCC
ncbi:MAG: LytTR family transcriptional regulator [Erysipelotrichaceae bacterium]|nr:LytTR family transcriptional regulator [Erysipelotrichaceae bacterium]